MKEITDLNQNNRNRIICLEWQLEENENEIEKIKDEISILKRTIEANEVTKETINESIIFNLTEKNEIKKLMTKLLIKKDKSTDNDLINVVFKDKESLEQTDYVTNVPKENQNKENDIQEIRKELEELKKTFNRREKKDNEINQMKKELESLKKTVNKDKKAEEIKNIIKRKSKQVIEIKEKSLNNSLDNFEMNLQDEYFKSNSRPLQITKENKNVIKCDNSNILNLKQIISQANNVVTHNINMVMDKEKQNLPRRNSMKPQPRPTKISLIAPQEVKKQRSKSPKPERQETIEKKTNIKTHLNEIYNKKAKDLANKMKKNITHNQNRTNHNVINVSFSVSRVTIKEEDCDSEIEIIECLENRRSCRRLYKEKSKDLTIERKDKSPERQINSFKSSRIVSAPTTKYTDVEKFINRDKPVQIKRDYSPMSLQQMRMEKQLRTNLDPNKVIRNIAISKNSVDFLKEMNKRMPTEDQGVTPRTEKNKYETENVASSVVNYQFTTRQSDNEKNGEEFFQTDILKSLNELNEIKKNLKVNKFLYKK
jgi:hypothetical protein